MREHSYGSECISETPWKSYLETLPPSSRYGRLFILPAIEPNENRSPLREYHVLLNIQETVRFCSAERYRGISDGAPRISQTIYIYICKRCIRAADRNGLTKSCSSKREKSPAWFSPGFQTGTNAISLVCYSAWKSSLEISSIVTLAEFFELIRGGGR